MAYYPDLSPYTYRDEEIDSSTVNVGWLDKAHKYPLGKVLSLFIDQLWIFCRTPVSQMRGLHTCELCSVPSLDHQWIRRGNEELRLGSAEIRVFGNSGIVYAAPDLIYHYVMDHHYRPPEEFIQAVLTGPQPGTPEYQKLVTPWINPYRR